MAVQTLFAATSCLATAAVGSTVDLAATFTPKALVTFWSGTTSTGDTNERSNVHMGLGFAASASDFRCVAVGIDSGGSTFTTAHRTDGCIQRVHQDGTLNGRADLSSFLTNGGARLEIVQQFGVDLRVGGWLLGGNDLTNAVTGSFTEGAADITLGFQADLVLFCSGGLSSAPPATTTGGHFMVGAVGFASGSPEVGVVAWAQEQRADSHNTKRYSRGDEAIALFDSTVAGPTTRGTVSGRTATTVTFTWAENAAAGRIIHYLALKGCRARVGSLLSQLDTTTAVTTGSLGFGPRGGLILGHGAVESTADTGQDHAQSSVGAWSSTSNQGMAVVNSRDNVGTAYAGRAFDHNEVFGHLSEIDGGGVWKGKAKVTAVGADTFSMTMSAADNVQGPMRYVVVGDAAAGGGATIAPLAAVHTSRMRQGG